MDSGRPSSLEPTIREPRSVSFREALRVWMRIGCLSFGGPAGQIALMHKLLVEELRWIGEARFLHALNYCMLLPGPEAQQLATYIGWLLHGRRGGLAAGILFVLPGALCVLGLSIVYATFGQVSWVEALFYGLKPAVLAIVAEALVRIGKRALKRRAHALLAAAAFVALFVFGVPFPIVVAGAGVIGFFARAHLAPPSADAQRADTSRALAPEEQPIIDALFDAGQLEHTRSTALRTLRTIVVGLALWFGPLALVAWSFGGSSVFVSEGLFFSRAAVVTFGGAYAVLAYVAQAAVASYHWLTPAQMLDALGLAETTPGPLILVTQFVGFLGAWNHPGELAPLSAAMLGAAVTTWVTFVPCFVWIFAGAPYIETLRRNRGLAGALSAITAAVVGVICNLALWFALRVIFAKLEPSSIPFIAFETPVWSTVDFVALALSLGALIAVLRFRTGMVVTLGASAVVGGVARHLLTG